MGKNTLQPPLMLTDKPWEEIEAERRGPPITPGPSFGGPLLQTIVAPIVISEELWQLLVEDLRRRYEPTPPPPPILMLTGPDWWERQRDLDRQPQPVQHNHQNVMAELQQGEANAKKMIRNSWERWTAFCGPMVDKYEALGTYHAEQRDAIKELYGKKAFRSAYQIMREMVLFIRRLAAIDADIIDLIAKSNDLINPDLQRNIIEGNNFWGINRIVVELTRSPRNLDVIEARLETVREKLNDYRSRSSNLRPGVRPLGPNGLLALPGAQLNGRGTVPMFDRQIRYASARRIEEIGILIQTNALRGARTGPNRNFWHTHVAGEAQDNMIVRMSDHAVMGFVDGHLSTKPGDRLNAQRAQAIEDQNTAGHLVDVLVIEGELYEVT